MKKYWFAAVSVLFILCEFLLLLTGPMATLERTSAILTPFYTYLGPEQDQLKQKVREIIESKLVKSGKFSVVKQSRFDDYFDKHPDEKKDSMPYKKYLQIAGEFGIKKLVIASLYTAGEGYSVYITVKDVTADITNTWASVSFDTIAEFESSTEIEKKVKFGGPAVSFFDFIYIGLLVLQLLTAFLAVIGKKPVKLIEIVISISIILFLFSFFYAKNANMDYFQRFVASKGQVTIAQDTRTEQLFAFIRFAPLILLNIVQTVLIRFRGFRKSSALDKIKKSAFFLTLLSAVLYALQFPNNLVLWGIPVLAWISLVPLIITLAVSKFFSGVLYGTVFGAVQAVLINFWQGTYSYIGLQIVAGGLIIEYLLFMLVLNGIFRISGKFRLLVIPFFWTFFEYLRSIGFLGFPWGLAGTSQFTFSPFIQLASVTGIWGLSFIVLAVNSALSYLVLEFVKSRTVRLPPKKFVFPLIAGALFILNIIFGLTATAVLDSRERKASGTRNILIIQQNTDPRKHDYSKSLDSLRSLSTLGMSETGISPDLIVWAEGAFKPDIKWWSKPSRANAGHAALVRQLVEYVREAGTSIVTGTQDHIYLLGDESKLVRRNMNSAALLNPDGSLNMIFHKMKLVPFTEHFPYKKEFPAMWELLQKYDTSNWLAGWERRIMETEGGLRFITPICFEDVFPDHIRRFVLNGVDIIANISNDYWSLSPVEGLQHGINGLFRAVENRRPMIRATSSGYTVYADAAGRIHLEVSEFYSPGYIMAEIPDLDRGLTIYTRFGDWFPKLMIILCAGFLIMLNVLHIINKRRRN